MSVVCKCSLFAVCCMWVYEACLCCWVILPMLPPCHDSCDIPIYCGLAESSLESLGAESGL